LLASVTALTLIKLYKLRRADNATDMARIQAGRTLGLNLIPIFVVADHNFLGPGLAGLTRGWLGFTKIQKSSKMYL